MSGASDKARFFLEQSVPELKEYEKKKIFSSDEITSIAKKRSDFEHKINARASVPSDYARYAEFEINVDALRRKRVKRLGIKSPTHTGQRRVFFVFDRGTRKHPGDIGLWMQSLEYARRQRAFKKLSQIFTTVLRTHPTKADLWMYAAQTVLEEHGDMTEARSYMQRGLRFCQTKKYLWLEYTRLELIYITKIHARRHILGLGSRQIEGETPSNSNDLDSSASRLPIMPHDGKPNVELFENLDHAALRTPDSTPIMTGAIPIAIFDSAMSRFKNDPELGKSFFELVAEFDQIPCLKRITEHILAVLMAGCRTSWQAQACYIKAPSLGISISSPDFPAALGLSLKRLKDCLQEPGVNTELVENTQTWLAAVGSQDLDPALRKVVESKLRSLGRLENLVDQSEN